jgi:hypothetical protein
LRRGRAEVRVTVRVSTQLRACDARKSERQKPASSKTNNVSPQQEEGRQGKAEGSAGRGS